MPNPEMNWKSFYPLAKISDQLYHCRDFFQIQVTDLVVSQLFLENLKNKNNRKSICFTMNSFKAKQLQNSPFKKIETTTVTIIQVFFHLKKSLFSKI